MIRGAAGREMSILQSRCMTSVILGYVAAHAEPAVHVGNVQVALRVLSSVGTVLVHAVLSQRSQSCCCQEWKRRAAVPAVEGQRALHIQQDQACRAEAVCFCEVVAGGQQDQHGQQSQQDHAY